MLLGGIATKKVDVTVTVAEIGPVLAMSLRGPLRGRTEREVWHAESPRLTEVVSGDGGFVDLRARVIGKSGKQH